jgi:hypothetical protein
MKPIFIFALLLGSLLPLHAQQKWCFSKNCLQTPATTFTLDRSDRDLGNIFRPSSTLPAYRPVAPLTFSPITRPFFLYAAEGTKMDQFGISNLAGRTAMTAAGGRSLGIVPGAVPAKGAQMSGPHFSTGQGRTGFTPTSPR